MSRSPTQAVWDKAATDPSFSELLWSDPVTACREMGLDATETERISQEVHRAQEDGGQSGEDVLNVVRPAYRLSVIGEPTGGPGSLSDEELLVIAASAGRVSFDIASLPAKEIQMLTTFASSLIAELEHRVERVPDSREELVAAIAKTRDFRSRIATGAQE